MKELVTDQMADLWQCTAPERPDTRYMRRLAPRWAIHRVRFDDGEERYINPDVMRHIQP